MRIPSVRGVRTCRRRSKRSVHGEKNGSARVRARGANFGAGDSKTASKLRKRDKSKDGRSRTSLNPNYDDPEAR